MDIIIESTTKQYGGDPGRSLGDVFSSIYESIAGLFRSAEEPASIGAGPTSLTAMREIVAMQDRLEEAKARHDDITQQADVCSAQMADITDAIKTITANLSTRYASNTAAALAGRISEKAAQWDELTAQAGNLAQEVLNLQREVEAKQRDMGEKSRSAHDLYR